jgi:endoglucanase
MSLIKQVSVLLTTTLSTVGCIPKDAPGTASGGAATLGPCPATAMIEDGEDDNNQVIVQEGRGGYVYTFGDKVGSTIAPGEGAFTMAAGGANGSKHSMHISGKIGTGEIVFAGLGVNFIDPKGPYDASKYGGISFFAKVGPGSTNKVRLKIPDVNTDPDGKVCTACFNDFGADLTFSEEWQKYTIPFSSASQLSGWGSPNPASIEKSKIYGVQFQVNDPGAPFDVWIDDITFAGCG